MRLLNALVLASIFWLALGFAEGRVAAACDPVGDIKFICGPISPEDLAVIPGDNWVIVSGDREGGRIHLINTWRREYPVPTAAEVYLICTCTEGFERFWRV